MHAPLCTVAESRQNPRLKLPAMYTLVRVRPMDSARFHRVGHIYDVSLSGMRLELDQPMAPGTAVEVRAMLPGVDQISFRATGRVVRLHDDADEPGPCRMGLMFDRFATALDRRRLLEYMDRRQVKLAA